MLLPEVRKTLKVHTVLYQFQILLRSPELLWDDSVGHKHNITKNLYVLEGPSWKGSYHTHLNVATCELDEPRFIHTLLPRLRYSLSKNRVSVRINGHVAVVS